MAAQILRFRTQTFDLSRRTLIMGVLNVTPDSFSDGGEFLDPARAVEQGRKLADEGADLLDIGGESTRPGSQPLPEEEELRRVIPVVEGLSSKVRIPLSIDTRKARVARRALEAGAQMVNDVSALRFDERMAEVAASWKVPLVLMHMRGEPATMQSDTRYDDLFGEITAFFRERMDHSVSRGIRREDLILDPGIGFGKSMEENHNLLLLKDLRRFSVLGQPLLVGASRKAFIGRILDLPPQEREEGSMAAAAVAVLNGANIVRVHEVKRTRRVVRVVDAVLRAGGQASRPPVSSLPGPDSGDGRE